MDPKTPAKPIPSQANDAQLSRRKVTQYLPNEGKRNIQLMYNNKRLVRDIDDWFWGIKKQANAPATSGKNEVNDRA
jgi:hypothetical protein